MLLISLGLALWVAAHMFKRLAPAQAQAMDEKQRKMIVAGVSLLAIVLMVVGYRGWDSEVVYVMPSWAQHLNNLLMLGAIYLLAASGAKTAVTRIIRHPMMTGLILWAVAHLLVNGDWASIVLFGVLLIWGVAQILIENAQSRWIKPPRASRAKEIRAVIATLVVLVVAGLIHNWLGYSAFGG